MTRRASRVSAAMERARLGMIDAAEKRRQEFAGYRARGYSVPRAARAAGISERTGWRYARTLAERAQAGR